MSRPIVRFVADYIVDGGIAVSVEIEEDGREDKLLIDGGGATVTMADWHRLEELTKAFGVSVQTGTS